MICILIYILFIPLTIFKVVLLFLLCKKQDERYHKIFLRKNQDCSKYTYNSKSSILEYYAKKNTKHFTKESEDNILEWILRREKIGFQRDQYKRAHIFQMFENSKVSLLVFMCVHMHGNKISP